MLTDTSAPTRETPERRARRASVNELLYIIGSNGRRFFYSPSSNRYAHFLSRRGRLVLCDHYSGVLIYMHQPPSNPWHGFSGGGTLKHVAQQLKHFIWTGTPIQPRIFGPWPTWYCDGDPWGYGAAMAVVRQEAQQRGIIAEVS